jgi:hypothetical protein
LIVAAETVADLLSASSVLLALYGFVFGVWYQEIDRGLGVEVPREHLEDAEKERERVGAAVFLPKSISLLSKLVRETHRGWPWFPQYSAIDTSYVLVSVAFASFAIWTVVLLIKLRRKRAKLRWPPKTS